MINKTGVPVLVAAFLAVLAVAGCGQANSGAAGAPGSVPGTTGAGAATSTTLPATSVNPTTTPGGTGGGSGSTPAAPTTTVAPAAINGLARIYVPQNQINAAAVKGGAPGQVQTAGGKYVVFAAEQSGCQKLSAEVTTQTASEVVITIVDTGSAGAGQMCPMIVREVQLIVELNAPLNNRTIVFQSQTRHG